MIFLSYHPYYFYYLTINSYLSLYQQQEAILWLNSSSFHCLETLYCILLYALLHIIILYPSLNKRSTRSLSRSPHVLLVNKLTCYSVSSKLSLPEARSPVVPSVYNQPLWQPESNLFARPPLSTVCHTSPVLLPSMSFAPSAADFLTTCSALTERCSNGWNVLLCTYVRTCT